MNAVQRIKFARQLLLDLSGSNTHTQRLQEVIQKLRNIPEECVSYNHFLKIKAVVNEFDQAPSNAETSIIASHIVHLCVDMIEYDSRVAELENVEY